MPDSLPHKPEPAGGFARVARRISSWSTRIAMSGLIVVAGLGFGRQVVKWWRAPGPGVGNPAGPSGAAMGLGDEAQPHVLQFGSQSWAIVRQTVPASRKEATRALRDLCRKAVEGAGLPDDRPGPGEREFLQWISAAKPVEEEPGRWRLYEFDDAFPMVVGTHAAETGESPSPALPADRTIARGRDDVAEKLGTGTSGWRDPRGSTHSAAEPVPIFSAHGENAPVLSGRSPQPVASAGPRVVNWGIAVPGGRQSTTGNWQLATRVVTWGIAVPGGPQEWTVYAFHPVAVGGGRVRLGFRFLPTAGWSCPWRSPEVG